MKLEGKISGDLEKCFQQLADRKLAIDRIRIDEYQFIVGIDDFEVTCFTRALLYEHGVNILEFPADYKKRSKESYMICANVGRLLKRIQISEVGLHFELQGSIEIVLMHDHEFENYSIQRPGLGVHIF